MNDTTPQPNEAPVEVCQEAKDASIEIAAGLKVMMLDLTSGEKRSGKLKLGGIIHRACLAYAQRKTEEATAGLRVSISEMLKDSWLEEWGISDDRPINLCLVRALGGLREKAETAEAQLTAAQADIAKLREWVRNAITCLEYDRQNKSVVSDDTLQQFRDVLATTDPNHERKP